MTNPQRTAKQNVHGALPSCRIECGCGHAASCDERSSSPPLLHHPLPPQGAPAGRKSKLKAYVRFNPVIVRYFQQNHQKSRGPAISPCQKSRLRLDHETADFIPSPPPSSRALHCVVLPYSAICGSPVQLLHPPGYNRHYKTGVCIDLNAISLGSKQTKSIFSKYAADEKQ